MKKKLLCAALSVMMLLSMFACVPMAQAAAAPAKTCDTKYPVLLVHGAGFRDKTAGFIAYWGRIPAALEAQGAKVYYGGQDAWGSIEASAAILKAKVDKILAETGAKKVNIIAHSKGGIEARYMISSLGMGGKVASLTTISTPHRGSQTIAKLTNVPDGLLKFASVFVNLWFRVLGDKHPDFYNGVKSLTPKYCEEFNKKNPDVKGVYYQSYAGAMQTAWSDLLLSIPFGVVKQVEGQNDGSVAVESAKWGVFQGVMVSSATRGISHADEVDMRRRNFSNTNSGEGISDIREFYVDVLAGLKKKGF